MRHGSVFSETTGHSDLIAARRLEVILIKARTTVRQDPDPPPRRAPPSRPDGLAPSPPCLFGYSGRPPGRYEGSLPTIGRSGRGGAAYAGLRGDAVDVVYATMDGYAMLGVPYMPHIAPTKKW